MKQKAKSDPSNESAVNDPETPVPITKQASSKQHLLRRTKFVAAYVESGNGQQSAIDAGYSPNGAHVQAHRMLNDATVQNAIREKTSAIYTEDSLKALLQRFLDKPEDDKLKLAALELGMRNLAMLTDKQRIEQVESQPIAEIAAKASESLSELTVTQEGIKAGSEAVPDSKA